MYELFIHLTLPNDYILPFLRTLDYLIKYQGYHPLLQRSVFNTSVPLKSLHI